ncbi:hypothetical protein BC831DRAFT_442329 [Entophlyctis helioformis]|nr:hypothetical protein BC831DRAFT_442329 [Entophlyctis helioformis]
MPGSHAQPGSAAGLIPRPAVASALADTPAGIPSANGLASAEPGSGSASAAAAATASGPAHSAHPHGSLATSAPATSAGAQGAASPNGGGIGGIGGGGGGGSGSAAAPPGAVAALRPSTHKPHKQPKICATCGKRIEGGQFVRAVGSHYHLECFRCQECNEVVADKFFPVAADGVTKIFCETDYFKRLDLICARCGLALRGPYINALNRKYHMDHFTCSVCPTVFRQHDSYYERDGQVFCGYHYSIFHAAKCGGCNTAVLKNFVEINKDQVPKQWHPPCYMIFKLWNAQLSLPEQRAEDTFARDPEVEVQKQQVMVERAERILQVLSAFEESAAACISEMLLHFSNESNLLCVLQAARFIQHVDILFSTIENINHRLLLLNDSSALQQTKEPKQLVKKIFYFFTNLSGKDTSVRQRATLGLIQQVTSLAHTLKKVIRTAFAGSLRLEQVHGEMEAVNQFLAELSSIHVRQGEHPTRLLPNNTDAPCAVCQQVFDDDSIKFDQVQWHAHCFNCTACNINLGSDPAQALCDPQGWLPYCHVHAPAGAVAGAEKFTRFQRFISLLWCTWSRLCLWLKIEERHLIPTTPLDDSDAYRDQNSSDDEHRHADQEEEFFDEDEPYTPAAAPANNSDQAKAKYTSWQVANDPSSDSDVYLSELSGLQHLAVRQLASLALHPLLERYVNLNQLLEIVEAPKPSSVWSKMVDVMKPAKRRRKGTFGVPLEDLVESSGVDSEMGVGTGTVRIPLIMEHCVRTLQRSDLATEGIFRKNGNIRRLKEVCERIDNDPKDIDLSNDNPIQIAALMKKFLREMPDPLLTFKLKDLFVIAQKLESEADRLLAVRLLCCLLPKPNLELLSVLAQFFHEVASYCGADGQPGNRMHMENIATVIAPNILYSKTGASPEDSVYCVRAVHLILENMPDVFKVPSIIVEGLKEDGADFNPTSKFELRKKYEDVASKVRNLQVSQNTGPEAEQALIDDVERD